MVKLYNWQNQALSKLKLNNYCGIVVGCTGSGKSLIGLAVFEELKRPPTLFVAPTVKIAEQWLDYLIKLGIPRSTIGLLGGGFNQVNRKYVVGVINSFRGKLFDKHKLVIYDEIHGLASEENIKFLIANNHIPHKVGLTATLQRVDGEHSKLLDLVGGVVYNYTQQQGIEDDVIEDYKIVNISVELTTEEGILLAEQNSVIEKLFPLFGKNYQLVMSCLRIPGRNADAGMLMRAFNQRKQILYKAKNKIKSAALLIKQHIVAGDKIVVFGENIALVQELAEELDLLLIPYLQYHGRKKDDISSYLTNKIRVLLSAKALDEGFNCPDINIGIILSGNSTKKQLIQRSGRILRKINSEKNCVLYQLYIAGTQDEKWLRTRLSGMSKHSIEWK